MNTPIVIDGVSPLRAFELVREILTLQKASPQSAGGANVGGWKSSYGVLSTSPVMCELAAAIAAELRSHDVSGAIGNNWAIVNRAGSSHPRHVHGVHGVIGLYFVAPGDPLVPTVYEFADGEQLEVMPAVGRLVIAPALLAHWVPLYAGEAPRITIAFDVTRRSL